jgi:hypothetical protein
MILEGVTPKPLIEHLTSGSLLAISNPETRNQKPETLVLVGISPMLVGFYSHL